MRNLHSKGCGNVHSHYSSRSMRMVTSMLDRIPYHQLARGCDYSSSTSLSPARTYALRLETPISPTLERDKKKDDSPLSGSGDQRSTTEPKNRVGITPFRPTIPKADATSFDPRSRHRFHPGGFYKRSACASPSLAGRLGIPSGSSTANGKSVLSIGAATTAWWLAEDDASHGIRSGGRCG